MEGAMFDDKMGTAVAMNAIGDRLITGAPLFDQVMFLFMLGMVQYGIS